jgi:hypothetical protein
MRALAAGPLGVLVMVAPLVAIPLLSTFGIPQFAPLVASPVDEDAEVDIVPAAAVEDAAAAPSSSRNSTPASHTADDLFAPLVATNSPERPLQTVNAPRRPGQSVQSDVGLVPLVPPGAEVRKPRRQGSSADRALSGWDVIPESEQSSRPDLAAETLASPKAAADRGAFQAVEREPAHSGPRASPNKGSELRLPNDAPGLEALDGSSGEELTWKGAKRKIDELNVRKSFLELMENGKFRFSCSVSNPDNPQVDRRFLSDSDEPLLAVEKVLRQVEEWRSSQ